jgi:K+-transporting ATPase ATPase C chain
MTLRREIAASAIGILTLTVICGVLYPLAITAVGQVAFSGNANGQLVYRAGRLVGSRLIGQSFATPVVDPRTGRVEMSGGEPVTRPDPRYFQTRPSGTVPADNAASSSFANYGPNSTITERAIAANIAAYIRLNGPYYPGGLTASKVPVDAADTSASGIDPDISIANAGIQAHRVAAVRHLPLALVRRLIERFTGGRGLGFSGEPTVNVLELNLALDRLRGGR